MKKCKQKITNTHLLGGCISTAKLRISRHHSTFKLLHNLLQQSNGGRWPILCMDLGNGHVKDFKTQLSLEAKSLREDPRFPDVTPLEEGLQCDKISNHYYPYSLPDYILPIEARPTHYNPDLIRAIGYCINPQGRLEEDNTYTCRRRIQIIEYK